jgi:hypothetical protein
MRILANYGYKNNGDTYSVTFETMGDVPKDQADAMVDELFALAKGAIERQISGQAGPVKEHEEIPIPKPIPSEQPQDKKNGNDRPEGSGLASDSQSHKPKLKDPDAPATRKQKSFIAKLAKERGQFIENLNSLTMQEASQVIDELMTVSV